MAPPVAGRAPERHAPKRHRLPARNLAPLAVLLLDDPVDDLEDTVAGALRLF